MKHLTNFLKSAFLALIPFLFKLKLVAGAGGVLSVVLPELAHLLPADYLATAGVVLYWLELLVRTVPTVANYSPVALALQILQEIVPNQAVSATTGEPGVHENVSIFKRIFPHHPALVPVGPATTNPVAVPDLTPEQMAAYGLGNGVPA